MKSIFIKFLDYQYLKSIIPLLAMLAIYFIHF